MAIFFNDQRLTHMSKGDAYLWSKFLNKYPDYFSNIRYDVRVGKSVKLKQDDPEWTTVQNVLSVHKYCFAFTYY
jgi:hypothetical protein